MSLPNVEILSECFIKPQNISNDAKQPIHFSPLDLSMLNLEYIQKGLLFPKPPLPPSSPPDSHQDFSITAFLQKLKQTLSATLTHFYPFSGQLVTQKQENPHTYIIYLDPSKGQGAKFIHAKSDLTVQDILSQDTSVLPVIQSLFDKDTAINHDGHTKPLLSVQVTQLFDGIFISCSINHVVCDGTSFWHFFNTWSELFQEYDLNFAADQLQNTISRPPLHHRRWYNTILNLPFTKQEQFIKRPVPPILHERIFHFSRVALSELKAKANSQCSSSGDNISTFQALTALLWKCITKARAPPLDQETKCMVAINYRSRLKPTLSNDYVGNYVRSVISTVTSKELLERENNIGWAAELLHTAIANLDEGSAQELLQNWVISPSMPVLGASFNRYAVLVGSSPRFNIYGCEFGLGKALAVRSGRTNKYCGKVTMFPGCEGGGSIDVEICLLPEVMAALQSDHEFTSIVDVH